MLPARAAPLRAGKTLGWPDNRRAAALATQPFRAEIPARPRAIGGIGAGPVGLRWLRRKRGQKFSKLF